MNASEASIVFIMQKTHKKDSEEGIVNVSKMARVTVTVIK